LFWNEQSSRESLKKRAVIMQVRLLIWLAFLAILNPITTSLANTVAAQQASGVSPLQSMQNIPQDADGQQGTLVIIGGGLSPDTRDIWQTIVEAAGGAGAQIAIIPTASQEPEDAGQRTAQTLERYGAKPFVVPLSQDPRAFNRNPINGDDATWAAKIAQAKGVFFTGGAQARVVDALTTPTGEERLILRAIRALYAKGGVLAGTSAGAALMSTPMFREPASQLSLAQNGFKKGQDIGTGLGFITPGWLVDQHFLARGRLARLALGLGATNQTLGVGIDEDTALVVKNDTAHVVGRSAVLFLDARSMRQIGANRLEGLRVSYLKPGDGLDLKAGVPNVGRAERRTASPINKIPGPALLYPDIERSDALGEALLNISQYRTQQATLLLADWHGVAPNSVQATPAGGVALTLTADGQTQRFQATGTQSASLFNIRLDIEPITLAYPLFRPR
jgi:cyanophycinase